MEESFGPKKTIREIDKEIEKLQRKMEAEEEADKQELEILIDLLGKDDPRVKKIQESLGTTEVKTENEPEKEKFDTKRISDEINEEIAEEEKKSGKKFNPEEKKNFAKEAFLRAKENFNKKTFGSSEKIKQVGSKTEAWWKNLDNTRKGKMLKAGMGAAFIGTATVALGSILGIAPTSVGGVVSKIGSRVAIATGLNMAITSNLTGKFFGQFLKKKEGVEEKKGWKKELTGGNLAGNIASVAGIGAAFLISGGTVAMIAGGGFVMRKSYNALLDYGIKKFESAGDDNMAKKMRILKGTGNGTLAIIAGLCTMNAYAKGDTEFVLGKLTNNDTSTSIDANTTNKPEPILTPEPVVSEPVVPEPVVPAPETVPEPVVPAPGSAHTPPALEPRPTTPATINPDSIINKGEGIEHALIRQIKNNPDLAKELGYKGDLDDAKSLGEFAGVKAHVIAIKTGYVDLKGNEVRVSEAGVGYDLKIENGQPTITELSSKGEVIEVHNEGHEFEKETDKHEYLYKKEGGPTSKIVSDSAESSVEPPTEKTEGGETGTQNIEESNSTSTLNTEQKEEYEDTSKEDKPASQQETNLSETQINLFKDVNNKEFTAETWLVAPENIYGISHEQLLLVNNIFSQTKEGLLALTGSNENKLDFTNTFENGTASSFISSNEIDIKESYQPLWKEINKIYEVTKLEPLEPTIGRSAETPENYIYRGMNYAASIGKIEKVGLVTAEDAQNTPETTTTTTNTPKENISLESINDISNKIKEIKK